LKSRAHVAFEVLEGIRVVRLDANVSVGDPSLYEWIVTIHRTPQSVRKNDERIFARLLRKRDPEFKGAISGALQVGVR